MFHFMAVSHSEKALHTVNTALEINYLFSNNTAFTALDGIISNGTKSNTRTRRGRAAWHFRICRLVQNQSKTPPL